MCIVFCFSSLILFLTSFVPLFDVQIVWCQPGLAVVSKLEVSKLISGSINEMLSVWLHWRLYRPFNLLSQRRQWQHGTRSQGPTAWMCVSANFVSTTVYLGKYCRRGDDATCRNVPIVFILYLSEVVLHSVLQWYQYFFFLLSISSLYHLVPPKDETFTSKLAKKGRNGHWSL